MIVVTIYDQDRPRFAQARELPSSSAYRYLLTMRHPFLPRLEWAVFSLTGHPNHYGVPLLTHALTSKYRIVPHPPLYINILESRIPLLLILLRLLRHAQAHARITPLPYSHTIAINFDYLSFLLSFSFFFLYSSIPCMRVFCFALPFKHPSRL